MTVTTDNKTLPAQPSVGFFDCASHLVGTSAGLKNTTKLGVALTDLFTLTYGKSEQSILGRSFLKTVDSTIGFVIELPEVVTDLTTVYKPGEKIVDNVDQAGRLKLKDAPLKLCGKISALVAKLLEFISTSAKMGLLDLAKISASIGNGCTFVITSIGLEPSSLKVITDSTPFVVIKKLGLESIKNIFAVTASSIAIVDYVDTLETNKNITAKALAGFGLVMEISKIALVAIGTFAAAWVETYLFVAIGLTLSFAGIVKSLCEKGPLKESFDKWVKWAVNVPPDTSHLGTAAAAA